MRPFEKTLLALIRGPRLAALTAVMLLLALTQAPAHSIEPPSEVYKKEVPVEIDADSISYERERDTYTAEGNVVATQEGSIIKADRLVLDNTARRLVAEGNLFATDEAGNEIRGSRFELELDDKTALLIDGTLFFKEGHVYVKSPRIRKTGPESYEASSASYTPCDCDEGDEPDWSFTVGPSKVTFGEYFTGRNAFFRIKGVPLLYSPLVVFPVNRERQTGFLAPRIGHSDRRGLKVDNSFFWAISDNFDSTFYVDVETKRGAGGGLEARGFRHRKSNSELYLYYFYENDIDRLRGYRDAALNSGRPLTADDDRYELKFFHDETLLPGVKLKADVHIVSDDEYFLDFSDDIRFRSLNALDNTVSLTWNRPFYSLVAEFRWFDDLLSAKDEMTLHRLPEVTFRGLHRRIPLTPLYLSFNTSFVSFVRETGQEGLRFDAAPKVSLPLNPLGLFELTPSFEPRYTAYRLDEGPGDRHPDRFIYEARAVLVTTFIRDFRMPSRLRAGLERLRHMVRPRAVYSYRPEEDQSDLPDFTSLDMIEPANEVEYSLTTSLTGRLTEEGDGERTIKHRYLYFHLSQVFDIREERRRLIGPDDKHRPLSDLSAELVVRPTRQVTIDTRAEYDVYRTRFNELSASLKASDKRGDKAGVSYRFNRETGTRYLEGSARVKVAKALDLFFNTRYKLDDDRALETSYGVEFNRQCWGVGVVYRDKPEENSVMLMVNLKTLGRVMGSSSID